MYQNCVRFVGISIFLVKNMMFLYFMLKEAYLIKSVEVQKVILNFSLETNVH